MKILMDKDNIIIEINESIETVSNGIKVNGMVYGVPTMHIAEIDKMPEGIEVRKYKYVDGEFSLNENYVEPIDTETEIINLKAQISELTIQLGDALLGGAL
ncbi:hypothetical protein SH2C18_39610 [Clostridium sediminicola]|uniref:hypothetical protein n=1 Tax=Clostridium sediminicola TaxID=3114879 RepID=UPI0031F235D9